MKTTLPLGPSDLEDSIVLEVSLADRDDVWSLWQAFSGESLNRPTVFWNKNHIISSCNNSSVEIHICHFLLGLTRD